MLPNMYIDSSGLTNIKIELQRIAKEIPGATASAVNRTIDFTANQTAREVTKEYAVKQKTVKSTIRKVKARKTSLYAYISSKGRSLSISKFQHTPKEPPENAVKFGPNRELIGEGYKVKVKIKKSQGLQEIKTEPKVFLGKIYDDDYGIYRRKGRKRMPVVVLRTVSIPQMISNEKIMKSIEGEAQKKLQERIDHEIEWRLKKAGGK